MKKIIAVLVVFFSVSTIANIKPVSNINYLKTVYPLNVFDRNALSVVQQLEFYYAPYPVSIYNSIRSSGFTCLSYMYACGNKPSGSIFRNLYDKKSLAHFIHADGYPSYHFVEVMHYDWYAEPALYFYVARGTGIFLNVGRTLVGYNKIAVLRKLGLSDLEILSYAGVNTYKMVKSYMARQHLDFKSALHSVINIAINGTNYNINRLANSTTYDVLLARLCRQHHFNTFQFTIQPNDNGGWGYELMDCRTPMTMPLAQRWRRERHYLSQRNPFNLKQQRACRYQVPFKKMLYC